jgi:phosphatidate cytidylyltransferase
MALNFRSLLTRTLTAAVFVAVLLSAIFWSYLSFTILFFIVSLWGLHEFYKISESLGARPFRISGYLISVILYLSVFFHNINDYLDIDDHLMNLGIAMAFAVLASAIFSKNEKPVMDMAYTVGGVFYTIVPFLLLNKYACMVDDQKVNDYDLGSTYNHHLVLGVILLIWASDTYAYLVGSTLGKHKLYERISPGKTWEGTIGGGVLTVISSYIVSGWFPEIQFIHWLVIAGIVVVFGTLGDLFESLLKRQAGVKDSGKIMPGHGGILDRFDSLMFVSPFVYLYLNWVLG